MTPREWVRFHRRPSVGDQLAAIHIETTTELQHMRDTVKFQTAVLASISEMLTAGADPKPTFGDPVSARVQTRKRRIEASGLHIAGGGLHG